METHLWALERGLRFFFVWFLIETMLDIKLLMLWRFCQPVPDFLIWMIRNRPPLHTHTHIHIARFQHAVMDEGVWVDIHSFFPIALKRVFGPCYKKCSHEASVSLVCPNYLSRGNLGRKVNFGNWASSTSLLFSLSSSYINDWVFTLLLKDFN